MMVDITFGRNEMTLRYKKKSLWKTLEKNYLQSYKTKGLKLKLIRDMSILFFRLIFLSGDEIEG